VLLCLLDADGETLRVELGAGPLAGMEGQLLPVTASFAGAAVAAGQPQVSADLASDARAFHSPGHTLPQSSAVAFPIPGGGRVLGAIVAVRDAASAPFSASDLATYYPFAEVVGAALINARQHASTRLARGSIEEWQKAREEGEWRERHEAIARARGYVAFEWEPRSQELRWGESYEAVFGAPVPNGATLLPRWAERIHPADRARVLGAMSGSVLAAEPLCLECRVLYPGGVVKLVRLREVSRLDGERGVRIIGMAELVAPRGAAAPERGDAVRELVRGLRHEINNPLAVVMGQAQLLRKESAVQESAQLRQSVAALYAEAERMQSLLVRLAAFEEFVPDRILNPRGELNLPARPD
jgi:signal transduction histidine kinase